MVLKIKKLTQNAKIPAYQTKEAAGFDLHSIEDVVIKPGERKLIGTGLAFEIEFGYEVQIRPRSGLAFKHGITVLNTPGTIDSDYRGEIKVLLINLGDEPFEIKEGERIAQAVVAPVIQAKIEEVDELSDTQRGAGGFGSTGK
ncbi:dUTP diphosphatase [Caminibacter pacificus]|jgi:dUTP pyrophosphatase|uniref:Deoxyuridine 5'-triphosphate nucleotidohydrolase n=1 Tax=Caminibacter pacificus TaxID=1424653 RepID=A0AAJ4RDC9_9BACT|nr:dUTP diphosphatase [Caminibacter pacificus]NPA87397.1 dUTP diphosphatase [Campylobacterota bacterium]QCI28589.1 dUTP diphosphatase [Caminibacter pacificus]ROR40682.1 deoxyuridine 5'-triphosphate nucleotidohydrolase [Caminibacter pacificus]